MNRRSLLALIGLAPVASVAPMPALARPLLPGEFIVSRHKARLYGHVSGLKPEAAPLRRISRHVEFANGEVREIGPNDRVVVTMEDASGNAAPSIMGIDGDGI